MKMQVKDDELILIPENSYECYLIGKIQANNGGSVEFNTKDKTPKMIKATIFIDEVVKSLATNKII